MPKQQEDKDQVEYLLGVFRRELGHALAEQREGMEQSASHERFELLCVVNRYRLAAAKVLEMCGAAAVAGDLDNFQLPEAMTRAVAAKGGTQERPGQETSPFTPFDDDHHIRVFDPVRASDGEVRSLEVWHPKHKFWRVKAMSSQVPLGQFLVTRMAVGHTCLTLTPFFDVGTLFACDMWPGYHVDYGVISQECPLEISYRAMTSVRNPLPLVIDLFGEPADSVVTDALSDANCPSGKAVERRD